MQGSLLSSRDRTGAAALVALLHVAVALAVLNLGGRPSLPEVMQPPPIETFEITEALPPPPVVEQADPDPRPRRRSAASAPNLRSEASPVIAPEPLVPLPLEPQIVVTPTPAVGAEATQGAASVAGPGTGAGGAGEGTGSGGAGDGGGGGGQIGGSRPALVAGQFRTRHYPRDLREAWSSAGPVLVTFQVQLNGRATGCRVYQSSGNPEIDRETCRLAETRLRFRPALDDEGRAYVASYGYRQAPVR